MPFSGMAHPSLGTSMPTGGKPDPAESDVLIHVSPFSWLMRS